MKQKSTKSRLKKVTKTESNIHTQTFRSSGFDCETARKQVANVASKWLESNKFPIVETHEHTHLDVRDNQPFFEVQITFTYKTE